jgi:hypothetical protein
MTGRKNRRVQNDVDEEKGGSEWKMGKGIFRGDERGEAVFTLTYRVQQGQDIF